MRKRKSRSALDMLKDEFDGSSSWKNHIIAGIKDRKTFLNTNVIEIEIDYINQSVTIYDEILVSDEPVVRMSIAEFLDFLSVPAYSEVRNSFNL